MTTTTSNFGLFKYDTSTDGQLAFNINQALNYNWDIIDANLGSADIATYETPGIVKPDGSSIYVDENGILSMGSHGYLLSTYHSGTTWFRTYSDGFKMCGGQVSTSASDIAFERPNLTANGTLGGSNFAVEASERYSTSTEGYKAVDGNTSTHWQTRTHQYPKTYTIYNPTKIKVSKFTIRNRSDQNSAFTAGSILAGNSTGSMSTIVNSWTNSVTSKGISWDINVNASSYYNYYTLQFSSETVAANTYSGIGELYITATYQGSSGTNITFPISFSNTNYSFQLGFQGGSGSSTYVSTKSSTGMTLSSTPSGTCSYVCMGW